MGIAPVELEEKEEKGEKEGNCPMLLVNSGLFRFEEELEGNLKSLIVDVSRERVWAWVEENKVLLFVRFLFLKGILILKGFLI